MIEIPPGYQTLQFREVDSDGWTTRSIQKVTWPHTYWYAVAQRHSDYVYLFCRTQPLGRKQSDSDTFYKAFVGGDCSFSYCTRHDGASMETKIQHLFMSPFSNAYSYDKYPFLFPIESREYQQIEYRRRYNLQAIANLTPDTLSQWTYPNIAAGGAPKPLTFGKICDWVRGHPELRRIAP